MRELTMTVICASCENQYGAWRPRCPACGTDTPIKVQQLVQKINRPRLVTSKPQRERTVHPTSCDLCHRRGAKETCDLCGNLVHHNCMGVHKDRCTKFQVERDAEIERVSA